MVSLTECYYHGRAALSTLVRYHSPDPTSNGLLQVFLLEVTPLRRGCVPYLHEKIKHDVKVICDLEKYLSKRMVRR